MESTITGLESSLKTQLSALADEIRSSEASLIASKEGYLKVQGALEVLDILKIKLKDDASLRLALSDSGAD